MIQDILPEKLINHYIPCAPEENDTALYYENDRLLARYDGEGCEIVYPRFKEFCGVGRSVYLFRIGDERFFLIMDADSVPEGYERYKMAELRNLKRRRKRGMFAAYTGYHLWKWYMTSRYCGACGAETEYDENERAKLCPVCGNKIYPRLNPAVIVGVTNGDKIILTGYRAGFAHNALIAGFTEIGETMEQTVRREVMEEVGLKVKNIRYYKSQPWGVASDILMGFYCELDGSDEIKMDASELKYAAWVERGDVVLQPTDDSLTNEMMRMFREGRERESVLD